MSAHFARAADAASELPEEEAARAHLYGLLARLFAAPPDAALLGALATAADAIPAQSKLGPAWHALAGAAARADPAALREEYETAFIGTGRAPVSLYAGAYTARYEMDNPLAGLRTALDALGLVRQPGVSEPEDHIAALCEVMRHLVAVKRANLLDQRAFFQLWILPAAVPLCDAINSYDGSGFYRLAAGLAAKFFTIEQQAFEML